MSSIDIRNIKFIYPIYSAFEHPQGFLCRAEQYKECHALFNYNICARGAYEENVLRWGLQYDLPGIFWNDSNFRQIFESLMRVYAVTQQQMTAHWSCVNMECMRQAIPQVPDTEEYRFNRVPVIFLN